METFEEWQIELHGHRAIYRVAGDGPPVVLIHGMLNASRHWREVALRLADRYTVVAPDLIGHGDSATPRGDYSLGAHAASIRDLLTAIGIERASIIGHSLGGGVAMQFFYQFPERTERLGLISSGGLGPEVSPLLRTAALPGASVLLSAVAHRQVLDALAHTGARMRRRGRRGAVYVDAFVRAMRPLQERGSREAFLQTLRSVIDVRGQRVSATDRLYLTRCLPVLIAWGERDNTIPLEHGRRAHADLPHSRLVTIPDAAHFPHLENPASLADALGEFLDATPAARLAPEDWHDLVAPHAPRSRRPALAA